MLTRLFGYSILYNVYSMQNNKILQLTIKFRMFNRYLILDNNDQIPSLTG
jgi:hypothetical protein